MPTNKVVPLTSEHLAKLLPTMCVGSMALSLEQSYLSPGSVAYCLLVGNEPVFAGGIVNMHWNRGEAWILPTEFFHRYPRPCFKALQDMLSVAAKMGKFKRVQATCSVKVSVTLFEHLGFAYEGTLKCFNQLGETCYIYARLF